jgi:hypothetical protein
LPLGAAGSSRNIQHLQRYRPTIEVASVSRLLAPLYTKQLGIERGRRVEIADLDVDLKNCGTSSGASRFGGFVLTAVVFLLRTSCFPPARCLTGT